MGRVKLAESLQRTAEVVVLGTQVDPEFEGIPGPGRVQVCFQPDRLPEVGDGFRQASSVRRGRAMTWMQASGIHSRNSAAESNARSLIASV